MDSQLSKPDYLCDTCHKLFGQQSLMGEHGYHDDVKAWISAVKGGCQVCSLMRKHLRAGAWELLTDESARTTDILGKRLFSGRWFRGLEVRFPDGFSGMLELEVKPTGGFWNMYYLSFCSRFSLLLT
jgi:hypothetical protein